MAGRRRDVDITAPLDFTNESWETELRRRVRAFGRQRPPQWIDYFVFPKGLFSGNIPDFVIGRPGWDNWLVWYPLSIGVPVFDASTAVLAVHQNHDYGYHPDGEAGVSHGAEARQNYRLLSMLGRHETLDSATYLLGSRGLKRNYLAFWKRQERDLVTIVLQMLVFLP